MKVLTCLILLLFSAKLAWNVLWPALAELRHRKRTGQDEPASIDMFLMAELSLLALAVVSAVFNPGDTLLGRPLEIALWGVVAILASYLVLMALARLIQRY